MAIIKKTISGLKPNTDYLFTLKPKNVEISATDIEQETIRVSVPIFDGAPSEITGLVLASNFQTVIFKFNPVNDIDLSYYEYQLYDNEDGDGSPINAVVSTANNSTETEISGTNLANVFLVSVANSTDETTNQYWGRVRAVNTSGNPSTQWSNLVSSGDLALIEDSFIASLTAAKITAGTISGQAITLDGANSIIKSSIYDPEDATPSGWYIQGDGSLSLGGPYGINYDPINGVTIGSSVTISPEAPIPDSSGVTFPGLTISTGVGSGVGGIALGSDGYNYWLTNGKFRTGSLTKYLYWDPTSATPSLTVVGDIKTGSSLDNGVLVGARTAQEVSQAATNFNADNDRNATVPTSPVVSSDGTAIDHTINTDGSADISFEWSYTTSSNPTDSANIDGFIVYVRDSASASPYTLGTSSLDENTYYISAEKRAFILRGVPADRYYTLGVRAYRAVNLDVDSSGYKQSPIIQSSGSGENPYRPSSSVAFAGNVTGTIDGTDVSTLVAYATAGNGVATNFNENNDRNNLTPTSPSISTSGSAVDHVINTDGSADISFEWLYTTSDTYNNAANIDGFIVYVYSSTSASSYVFGTSPAEETTYYLPRDKRAFILPAAAADRHYTFGVRAYRMVDTDVNSAGIVYSPIVKSAAIGEDPFQPSSSVAFGGNIIGTIDGMLASIIKDGVNNFNNNNDRILTDPATPTSITFTGATNLGATTDLTVSWNFVGTGDAYNIDGFVVYLRKSSTTNATNIAVADLANTDIQVAVLTQEKRSHTFSGVPSEFFYRAAIRAYRVVDNDIDSTGVKYGTLANSSELASSVPKIGGTSGISVGTSKIYIGNGNHNNTDTGFYADGLGKFSLRDQLVWDPTLPTPTLTIKGTLSGTTGTFSGRLSAGDIYIPNSTSPVFSVTSAGALTATSANITGVINASSGTFSGNITAGLTQVGTNLRGVSDYAGMVLRSDSWENGFLRRSDGTVYFRAGGVTDRYIYLDTYTPIDGSTYMIKFPNFSVNYNGNLSATSANISGTITATAGDIGGFTISSTSIASSTITINSSTNRITVGVPGTNPCIRLDSDEGIFIGSTTFSGSPFSVTMAGALKASSGTIGGFTINSASLTRTGTGTSTRLQVGDECVLTGSSVTAGSISGAILASTNASTSSTTPIQQVSSGSELRRFTSRREYKHDIEDLDDQDRKLIDKLRPRKFKWNWTDNSEESDLSKYLREKDITFGFIAEEMAEIDTEGRLGSFGIYEPHEDSFQPIFWRSYDLISLLVSEVQDLRKRILLLESSSGV